MKTSNHDFLEELTKKAIEDANKLDVDEPDLVWPEPEEVRYQGPMQKTKDKRSELSKAFSNPYRSPLSRKSPEYRRKLISQIFDMVRDGSLIPESPKGFKPEETMDKVEREATSKFQQGSMFEPNQQGLFGKVISRSEAFEIANKYVKTCPLEEGVGIRKILSIEEIGRRPCIYNYSDEKMKNYWIAYVNIPSKEMISSSTILLISKETGEIIYAGSANDEG